MSEPIYALETKHSEQINEIAKALCDLQADIPAIPKTKRGHHGFMYADINDMLKVVHPLMKKNGLCFIQSAEVHNGHPYMMTKLMHPSSGQWLTGYARMFVGKADSMGYGAAQTYSRRYCLSCLLGICTEEDSDGVKEVPKHAAPPSRPHPTANQAPYQAPSYDDTPF